MRGSKYEVFILGPGASKFGPRLKRTLRGRLRELSADLPGFVSFYSSASILRHSPTTPTVGVFFGTDAAASDADLIALDMLLGASKMVLPVVDELKKFATQAPSSIAHINGSEIEAGDPKLEKISNVLLENLGLLRSSRRLFISYKRDEASTVALQLRDSLSLSGFDPFLDIGSIRKSDPFQEVLWQRLADSDLMLMCDTPGFVASRWTQAELAEAAAMTVGILQLIWPGHNPLPYTGLCARTYFTRDDFDGTALRQEALVRIVTDVERLRARTLAARHDNLVRDFCDAAARMKVATSVQPDRYIVATLPSGKRIAAVPAVGVPDALRYHEASKRFPVGKAAVDEAMLIYDQRGLRPAWGEFLDWLDEFLPVTSVRVTNVAAKLVGK